MDNPLTQKKPLGKAQKILEQMITIILLLVILATSAVLINSAFKRENPKVMGFELFTVDSGSMLPTFPIGSVILVKAVPAVSLAVGDIILFQRGDTKPVTHRILRIEDPTGPVFITQGDANSAPDSVPVQATEIKGKITYVMSWTVPLVWLMKQPYLLMLLAATLVAGAMLRKVSMSFKRMNKKTSLTDERRQT